MFDLNSIRSMYRSAVSFPEALALSILTNDATFSGKKKIESEMLKLWGSILGASNLCGGEDPGEVESAMIILTLRD